MRFLTRLPSTLPICAALLLLAGCARAPTAEAPITIQRSEPAWPTDGWPTSSPEAQGMDSRALADMLGEIQDQGYDIDSVTVVRDGYLVLDAAAYPYRVGSKHVIHSCTKSIVATLIGIAIEQGYIEGVQTPLLDLFPARTVANLDAAKRSITLEHLLTMTSGLDCRDSYLYRWSGLNQMRASDDWVQFVLDLPMAATPGTKFEYCNGGSFLLSAILTERTGSSALEFAREHLFGPLGITDLVWPANPKGINIGWGELRMLPQDMAKIGYLFLRGGEWDREQIVPSDWVEASTREYTSATLQDGYGYQWWVDDSGMYMALGYAGQFIFVVPEHDLVVAFTSDLSESDFYLPQILLREHILPAVVSLGPIPEDSAAASALQQQLDALASP